MSILELFCSVDDFWRQFAPSWQSTLLASEQRKRLRAGQMYPSEMMTIVVLFQQSHYRTFKAYYTEYVHCHLRSEFSTLLSYQRFVELMPTLLVPLVVYLHTQLGHCSGISFIDSTSLVVCHNARIHQHRVFAGRAARGKTSVGWFYGFKLHLVVNDQGELLAFCLTPAMWMIAVRSPGSSSGSLANSLVTRATSRSLCWSTCWSRRRVHLIAKLRKRAIIETINDQLKNICQIEHSRHRSPINFLVNLVAGLIAYCHQPRKPSLGLQP